MDLSPARWIWFPSQRTLPSTFVLFRREVVLEELPIQASGWVVADSRYRLTVNGRRVQWGPTPCDPRYLEADPLDISAYLRPGLNVIGLEVLYYGHGDGTWVSGKPGLLLRLNLKYTGGRQEQLISDASWLCLLDRAHPPGQYKRWFLRALQEEFDARLHPVGWNTPHYTPDERWLPAQILDAPTDKPAAYGSYSDYLTDARTSSSDSTLSERSIPLLREVKVPAMRLTGAGRVQWQRDPRDWFEMRTPGSFSITRDLSVVCQHGERGWELQPVEDRQTALYVTFEWEEQLVGWPYFTIEAADGTIVEVIIQESHDPVHGEWLDTHFYSWSRFICRAGLNTFESFDFESLRWLQFHIRAVSGPIRLLEVGVRRRMYPWPHQPQIHCSEPALQRVFNAGINTLYNSVQETAVDGMGRERQQYSGDGGHQLQPVRTLLGETRLPRRFLHTYSSGQTFDGYFLHCWPAYDTTVRLAQRQTGTTIWGPILDHSVGFVFDCWNHYLESGDLAAVRIPYSHLWSFIAYLQRLRATGTDGLLPVENLGVPTVWIDHEAYQQQRHKQCAFNLYTSAMLLHAFVPLAETFGEQEQARQARKFGEELLSAVIQHFWDSERHVFINNRPWLDEEQEPRMCDRSLATAILFEQCPDEHYDEALKMLVEVPPEMGFSYPANAGWRYQALGRGGRVDVILQDLRTRWAGMQSVQLNNTLQEFWHAQSDSTAQWSHCPIAPLIVLVSEIVGMQPLSPGFARYTLRPQLADLPDLAVTIYTGHSQLAFRAVRENNGHRISLSTPANGEGILLVPRGTVIDLPELPASSLRHEKELVCYQLAPAQEYTFWLPGS